MWQNWPSIGKVYLQQGSHAVIKTCIAAVCCGITASLGINANPFNMLLASQPYKVVGK